ncbi:MAG: pentapeptide repeat-containing protein [Cyanobacteria bacterium P01_G01_bin.4]
MIVQAITATSIWFSPAGAIERQDLQYLQATGQCPQCDLKAAILTRASLSGAQLMEANLVGAELAQASLIAANLFGANLQNANLAGANLSGADLGYANISSANLIGAALFDVNWNGAVTEGALYSEETLFDDTVNPAGLGMILVEDGELPLSYQSETSNTSDTQEESTRDHSVR